jgi:hypothetical protein
MRERAAAMERTSIAIPIEKLPPQRKRPGIRWPSMSVVMMLIGIGIVSLAYAGN